MERMEFVGEAADAEYRWPVSRENPGKWQPRCSRLCDGGGQTPDEFWMQPSDRALGPLPRHGIARRRGLDQIGACARRLAGFWCMPRTATLAHRGRLEPGGGVVYQAALIAISAFYRNSLDCLGKHRLSSKRCRRCFK